MSLTMRASFSFRAEAFLHLLAFLQHGLRLFLVRPEIGLVGFFF